MQSIQNVLAALFVASIGLVTSPRFLAQHLRVLLAGAVVVLAAKSAAIAAIVRAFGVDWRTSWAVGCSLAHIGEFGYVLLAMASQMRVLPPQVYMLLLGVTAVSLLSTPAVISVVSATLLRGSGGREQQQQRQGNGRDQQQPQQQEGGNGLAGGGGGGGVELPAMYPRAR